MSIARLFTFVAAAAAAAAVPAQAYAAPILPTMLGDDVHVVVRSAFDTPIDGEVVVTGGVELSGSNVFWSYEVDLSAHGFEVTVSKPYAAGNFTAIFGSILIEGLDVEVLGVAFDATRSSAFSSGDPESIDLSVPGRILVDFGGSFASGNEPATALSHTYRWNVRLGDDLPATQVPEPSGLALVGLGLAALGSRRGLRDRDVASR